VNAIALGLIFRQTMRRRLRTFPRGSAVDATARRRRRPATSVAGRRDREPVVFPRGGHPAPAALLPRISVQADCAQSCDHLLEVLMSDSLPATRSERRRTASRGSAR
jgi:hypothetical protein